MSAAATLFDRVVEDIGEAAEQVTSVAATEGTVGNISVFLESLSCPFQPADQIELPVPAPALAGGWVVITAAQHRLRDVARQPESAIAVLHIHLSGQAARVHAPAGTQPSSEWASHIAIHDDHRERRGVDYHAVLHAQPMRLVFLSHLPEINTAEALTERMMRWGPETAVVAPDGVELVAFPVPGSDRQLRATIEALARSNAVVWAKHAIVTRSDSSATHAADVVEYLEAAASYEVLNLSMGSPAPGLDQQERAAVVRSLGIDI